ncbi:hypothetical protein KS4_34850 [Poriferisphaera corsica]|uniref:PilZ domain-containing protein n=2 Tax=Poriferisphaera corsica TaxID=2528020 RepID=A0A517YYV1_9BACT|nr:hypothetical protein KS4_34850 [Poriferisphaera corsica]
MVFSSSKNNTFVDQTILYLMQRLEREGRAHHLSQRVDHRHNVHAPAKLGIADRDPNNLPVDFKPLYHAWITDISSSGVGMLLEHDLPHNVIMWLNLGSMIPEEHRPEQQQLLPIRIAYCMKLLPHTYRVGGAFVKDISSIPDKAWQHVIR